MNECWRQAVYVSIVWCWNSVYISGAHAATIPTIYLMICGTDFIVVQSWTLALWSCECGYLACLFVFLILNVFRCCLQCLAISIVKAHKLFKFKARRIHTNYIYKKSFINFWLQTNGIRVRWFFFLLSDTRIDWFDEIMLSMRV